MLPTLRRLRQEDPHFRLHIETLTLGGGGIEKRRGVERKGGKGGQGREKGRRMVEV